MKEMTCLVTGANAGIGKEIALSLATAGAQVIMVCRDAIKGKAALEEVQAKSDSKRIDLLIADLSSQTDIRLLSKTIHDRYSKLNILINNADVVVSKRTLSADNIELTLATNYLGPFLLTQLLLDLLERNKPSRIINISSAIHKWARIDLNDLQFENRRYQLMKAYAQSKLLMNIATFELARRLSDTGVTVNCVHPGAVRTNLGSNNASNFILKFIDRLIKFFFISPQEAAKAPFYLATSPEMENVSSSYFVKEKPIKASAICYDITLGKNIWEKSEKLVGL